MICTIVCTILNLKKIDSNQIRHSDHDVKYNEDGTNTTFLTICGTGHQRNMFLALPSGAEARMNRRRKPELGKRGETRWKRVSIYGLLSSSNVYHTNYLSCHPFHSKCHHPSICMMSFYTKQISKIIDTLILQLPRSECKGRTTSLGVSSIDLNNINPPFILSLLLGQEKTKL